MATRNCDTVMGLPYPIWALLRYRGTGIDEWSTRADVRGRLDQIRQIRGIGPRRLEAIQNWLDESRNRLPGYKTTQ